VACVVAFATVSSPVAGRHCPLVLLPGMVDILQKEFTRIQNTDRPKCHKNRKFFRKIPKLTFTDRQ